MTVIEDDIELSVIDVEDAKKLQEKKKKIQRVMEVIRENELEKDEEFITEINDLIEGLLEEK